MIISKTVLVKLSGSNVKHFESLGYIIPKYHYTLNYQNVWRIKIGTSIEVKIEHLQPKSNTKVLCKCDICGNKKWVIFNNIKNINKYICHCCSLKTDEIKQKISSYRTGKHMSLKTKQKISNSLKGRIFSKEHLQKKIDSAPKGKNHPNYNPKLSENERKKCHKIPGIGKWRKQIKERDNYTCQKCGCKKYLQVHHINNFKNFKEQRLDINNGITLCKECHISKNGKSIHNIYGWYLNEWHFNNFMKN